MLSLKVIKFALLITVFLSGTSICTNGQSIQKWKDEIVKAEKDFAAMAKDKGVKTAFLEFAAEDAVLKQENTLHIGKDAIRIHLERQPTDGISLSWKPEFVDVSSSGDLGYTYGYYTLTFTDPEGKKLENKGVFHTVWKRQTDGSWKFVWD